MRQAQKATVGLAKDPGIFDGFFGTLGLTPPMPSVSSLPGPRFVENDDRREALAAGSSHLLRYRAVRLGQNQQSGRSLLVSARARQPNVEVGLAMAIFGARHEGPPVPALPKRLRGDSGFLFVELVV
jgi:hypothetical protein